MMRTIQAITAAAAILAIAFFGANAPAPAQGVESDGTPPAENQTPAPPAEEGAETPVEPEQPGQSEAIPEGEADETAEPELLTQGTQALTQMSLAQWVEQPNIRIAGADRYSTAVEVSKRAYSSGAQTVLIATGLDFPDALSAAALGAKIKAPLLLTEPYALPASTRAELARLAPTKIVIIGGPSIVSASVEAQLRSLAPTVTRIYGSDRYETSAAIARAGWTQASQAFLATGADFADALPAAAAAGKLDAPVLLVPSGSSAPPPGVQSVLRDLGVSKIHIAGGTGAVSQGMQNALGSGRTVARYAGANRFDTSAAISTGVFTGSSDVYWANAGGFADALTGAAVAGAQGAPLLLVDQSCVPATVYKANDRVTSGQTFLLGGSGVLADTVLIGNECMTGAGMSAANRAGTQTLYTHLNLVRYRSGLSAFRLADAAYGTPAYSWSASMVSGGTRTNPNLLTQQPWAAYQAVAQTSAGGDKASRLGALMLGNAQARSWLLKPSGGVRGAFSVGYAISGATAYGTVIVGTNLK